MSQRAWSMMIFGASVLAAIAGASCVGDSNPMNDAGDAATTDTSPDNTVVDSGVDSPLDAPSGDANDGGAVTITDIAAGQYHACALASNGAVYCWGSNIGGEVGVATSKNATCTGWNTGPGNIPVGCITAPTLVSGVTATKIAAGFAFTCAIDTTGNVWCWGMNYANQLGHQTGVGDSQCNLYSAPDASAPYACNSTPTKVAGVAGAADITAGATHVCVRTTTNAVYCWGDNSLGEIGNTSAGASTYTPTQPMGLPPVVEVRGGFDYDTCAVAVSGGSVYCWGFDDWGQLSVPGATTSCSGSLCMKTPTQVVGMDGGVITGANHVAVGHAFSCAVSGTSAGCWGLDFRDTFTGSGSYGPLAASNATGLEARWEAQCTLTGNRTCWGQNLYGDLGDGTFGPDGGNVLATPEALAAPANVTKLAGGVDFFVGLTSTGDVYTWGQNWAGALAHDQGAGSPADVHCNGPSYCNATPQKVTALP